MSREEIISNEVFPCNTLQAKLMQHYKFNECIVINTVVLLLGSFPMHESGHSLDIPAHEIREVHHPHPGEIRTEKETLC